jgi:hypothetical protein
MRFAGILAVVLAVLLASSGTARANGRYPESNALVFSPSDSNLVLLRVTFGALLSHDRGKTWDWICEPSIGSVGIEDPMYAITPNGNMMASTLQGVTVSRDGMCSFAFAGGAAKGRSFLDVAARSTDPRDVVAIAADTGTSDAGLPAYATQLFETADEGQSFVPVGAPLDPTLLPQTVDLTADAQRVYVTALRNPASEARAVFLVSRDRGKSWVESPIPLEPDERETYIAAVDPSQVDRVYVRTTHKLNLTARLLVTEDAGKTFRTVFTGKGPLAGFALSPDGKKVFVGGPDDGISVAATSNFVFTRKTTLGVRCLALQGDGLWACSSEKDGFVVGLSKDDGATFEPRAHFCSVRGALACAAGTSTSTQCVAAWAPQRDVLGCPPSQPQTDAAAGGAPPKEPNAETAAAGGCDCRSTASLRGSRLPLSGIVAAALILGARLRRRRGGST